MDVNASLIPNYGSGCIVAEPARNFYVLLVETVFLLLSLVFAFLAFYTLYKTRNDTEIVRESKHGGKETSRLLHFHLNMKQGISLFLIIDTILKTEHISHV